MKINNKIGVLALMPLILVVACRKFIIVPPPTTQLVSSSVFESDQSAESALTGIYSKMMESSTGGFSGGSSSIGPLCGLAADELSNYSSSQDPSQFYQNAISPNNSLLANGLWGTTYQYIYAVNSVLEGVSSSKDLSDPTRVRLIGEAKFLRAFYYFYLINLFDSVPLITTTQYEVNAMQKRSSLEKINQQIGQDLQDAEQAFEGSLDQAGALRPGLSAVHFLQARYYLYQKDWNNALEDCNKILNSSVYSLCSDIQKVFLKESSETVWQLMPVATGANTWDGFYYILLSRPSKVTISPSLLSAFEEGDLRRSEWIDSFVVNGVPYFFPYKYKIKTGTDLSEYQVVFRLSELLLIRAEAQAELGNIPAGDDDINLLRARVGLSNINSYDINSFRNNLMHERQVELFTEWGQRWFDLKRTGIANAVLGPLKGSDWQPTDVWLPIPQSEIQNDPNLTQNGGY